MKYAIAFGVLFVAATAQAQSVVDEKFDALVGLGKRQVTILQELKTDVADLQRRVTELERKAGGSYPPSSPVVQKTEPPRPYGAVPEPVTYPVSLTPPQSRYPQQFNVADPSGPVKQLKLVKIELLSDCTIVHYVDQFGETMRVNYAR